MTRDTYVFDIANARRGAPLNRLCGSLKDADNRRRFQADENAYCDEYGLPPEQKQAILRRDWAQMLELGGSIFYTYKLAQVDKLSMQYLGGVFTGTSEADFKQLMRAGGRSFG